MGDGLARRAVLEAGRRLPRQASSPTLHTRSTRTQPSSRRCCAASPAGRRGGGRAIRAAYLALDRDAPPLLGPPPSRPRRWTCCRRARPAATLAVNAAMANLFESPTRPTATGAPRPGGQHGVYEGPPGSSPTRPTSTRVQQGDVLVDRMTTPYFTVVLPLLGAIVTDRGGQLSHAAIVAREYGIPGIVGTREATRTIPDGARVRVDGRTGEVRLLG